MAKPYSQDLRDRVLDAVDKEGMSRRAAADRFGIGESSAIRWIRRLTEAGSRMPAGAGGHRRSKLMPHRDFFGGRTGREARHHSSGALRPSAVRAGDQGRHFDDEPLLSPDRRHGQKKTLVAREQDRPDIS